MRKSEEEVRARGENFGIAFPSLSLSLSLSSDTTSCAHKEYFFFGLLDENPISLSRQWRFFRLI
jgi:hypothetical protein